MRTGGAPISRNQPELSYEVFRASAKNHAGIDALPTLKEKEKYAAQHSAFRNDAHGTYTISTVGQVDWGGMAEHIRSVHTLSDGNLMLEVNALPDRFCIAFQLLRRKREPVGLFCKALEEEGWPCTVSERLTRYLPEIELPMQN